MIIFNLYIYIYIYIGLCWPLKNIEYKNKMNNNKQIY